MHQTDGPSRGQPVDDAVRRAIEQFDDAVDLLGQTKEKLKRGEIEGLRDIGSQIALVIKTLVVLGEARGKIDDLVKNEAGARAGSLDLDAARLEVWSRLDRLRAARHS